MYISSDATFQAACNSAEAASISAKLREECAAFNFSKPASIGAFLSADNLSPNSFNCFSVEKIKASAPLILSASSFCLASSAALASASSFIFLISASVKPEDASIRIFCSLPVALSFALTCKIPLASISNDTST
ncbi:hypothetical protein D3C86_1676350 [compost metagenome]